MKRIVNGLGALGVLVLVVLGAPIGLWQAGRLDGLAALWREFPQVLLHPDDGTVLLGLLSLLGWAAWAAFTLAVLGELVGIIGRRRIRLPGLGRPQAWASGLLLAVLALSSVHTVAEAHPSRFAGVGPTEPDSGPRVEHRAAGESSAGRSTTDLTTDEQAGNQPRTQADPRTETATLTPAERIALATSGLSALTAAAMLVGLGVRREVQLAERPVGVRMPRLTPGSRRLEQAMGQAGDPLTLATLDRALRALGKSFRARGEPLPELGAVLVGEERISVEVSRMPQTLPPGFHAEGTRLWIGTSEGAELAALDGIADEPAPYPLLVCLGEATAGGTGDPEGSRHLVMHDLETIGILGLQGNRPLVAGVLQALLLELAWSWWGGGHEVVVVGGDPALVDSLDNPFLSARDELDPVLGELEERLHHRPPVSTHSRDQRLDATTEEAWRATVLLVERPLRQRQRDRLEVLRAQGGVVAVVADPSWPTFELQAPPRLSMLPNGCELTAQVLGEPVRRNLVELFTRTGIRSAEQVHSRAPWWTGVPAQIEEADDACTDDEAGMTTQLRPVSSMGTPPQGSGTGASSSSAAPVDPAQNTHPDTHRRPHGVQARQIDRVPPINNVTALGPRRATRTEEVGHAMDSFEPVLHPVRDRAEDVAPMVLLLGPLELVAARGPVPTRARRQCIEYCAWLLENPQASSGAMTNALFVAEPTRRSNMSRLRSWLGSDSSGEPYLPDAYSGRICLHPEVSSDWNRMQLLTAGGVDRSTENNLVQALELVRGAPLADAAPGQWHWAEELRSDMSAMVRDIGMVLATRALQRGDLELARWASNRALVAAAEDERLLGVRLRIEHAAGNRHEVERLALRLVRQARRLNIDLHEDTVALLQLVMEGGTRTRDLA